MTPMADPGKYLFSRRVFMAAGLCLALLVMAAGAAPAQTDERDPDADLIEKLRDGGYNLYIRHAATDWSQNDRIDEAGDWTSCDPGEVRQLSGEGRRDARALGAALRALEVRLGRVFASPYCRTMETARLISGKDVTASEDLMNLRSAAYVGGREAVVARARARLSQAPADGVNDLFSAHGNLARAAIDRSPGEGEILVLAPRGDGGFDVVGALTPSALKAMAGQ